MGQWKVDKDKQYTIIETIHKALYPTPCSVVSPLLTFSSLMTFADNHLNFHAVGQQAHADNSCDKIRAAQNSALTLGCTHTANSLFFFSPEPVCLSTNPSNVFLSQTEPSCGTLCSTARPGVHASTVSPVSEDLQQPPRLLNSVL